MDGKVKIGVATIDNGSRGELTRPRFRGAMLSRL
jgi:hypothetical protein